MICYSYMALDTYDYYECMGDIHRLKRNEQLKIRMIIEYEKHVFYTNISANEKMNELYGIH